MVNETFQPEGFFSKEVASFEKKCFFLGFFIAGCSKNIFSPGSISVSESLKICKKGKSQ